MADRQHRRVALADIFRVKSVGVVWNCEEGPDALLRDALLQAHHVGGASLCQAAGDRAEPVSLIMLR